MLIEVRDISKVYASSDVRTRALRNVSFKVTEGEFVAVTGPSGCGKSTLMNMLGLLDFPDEGTVSAFGSTLSKHDERALTNLRRGNIGFVFQAFNLIEQLSVQRNVEMPLEYLNIPKNKRAERAKELLETVSLSHRANHRPSQLSGGQQQRVAIARALSAEPKLVVADEPTGNLDSSNSIAIMTMLEKLTASGTAVVVVTHSPELAAMARRQVFMRDGMIVDGAH